MYRCAAGRATLRHSPITQRKSGGHHGKGSDAQQQRKEEAEAGQEQEERRRSALTVRRHAQPGQTRHLVHESIRQEALAGDHRARPQRAPYHFRRRSRQHEAAYFGIRSENSRTKRASNGGIVGSTEKAVALGDRGWHDLLDHRHATTRRNLARFRGHEIKTTGDGILATFDGPARGVRCACAIADEIRPLGIEIRAGLHSGKCEMTDDDVGGIAVHIGSRIAALAGPSEVLVSSTVRDLVAGSGLRFSDRGSKALKGVPGEWHVYAVER